MQKEKTKRSGAVGDRTTWQYDLRLGYAKYLNMLEAKVGDPDNHFCQTPDRIVRALDSMFYGVDQDPTAVLKVTFTERRYDQMVWVEEIPFISWCRHHLLPFFGKVHFAYLPRKRVVGLSKIPRLVDILSARPQLQENLAEDIVKYFQDAVKPIGCGVLITAHHTCMSARGARSEGRTKTVALRGEFRKASVKQEFLGGIIL